ncbi:cytochrome bc1 complex Rieske iron-sulfur subunit [Catellatospora tritici]|uniref:cytochrome bc1 complex Rieske iron-sulfur subunit n=1 Tax=Catellatospora tritici TaxID=2851566 RepID=UPI001C2DE52E|nr:Rieske 2Fe-2S domain-containing protein [Catellatospora tritici]MBV1852548.1 Rieske 2Fe-2S domain-containing protein [Catellatospora tritici]
MSESNTPVVDDLDDPNLTTFDIVREGARRDGIEIVHYEPQYPAGSKGEKRMVRIVAFFFLLTGLAATAFVIAFIWWPWEYEMGSNPSKLYTPILGLTLGLALVGVGLGILTWGKKLLPHEISIQDRHDGPSDPVERKITGETLKFIGSELSVARRPALKLSLLGLLPLGAAAVALPIGAMIKDPHHPDVLFKTGFAGATKENPIKLVRDDYTPIRPEEVSTGGQITVFPGIPGGVSNKYADSPTLLIHLREGDAEALRFNLYDINKDSPWQSYVAYSKICTHAGCPASLYEQQTNRLLCPCHQSQFLITDNAKPIFGPATRSLPMLPITVDKDGHFAATGDYKVPVGPAFWEKS